MAPQTMVTTAERAGEAQGTKATDRQAANTNARKVLFSPLVGG